MARSAIARNKTEKQKIARFVRKCFPKGKVGQFAPFVMKREKIDQLLIMEEDCSYVEENVPGSAIGILRKNYGKDAGKVIGVIIYCWSRWAKNL